MVVGRADSAKLGSFVLDRPVGATGGVQLIGTEVLRRFHVVFDYSRQRIILEHQFPGGPTVSLAAGMTFFTLGYGYALPMARLQVGHAF
ncbi:MAG TPA: hypothetical protein VFB81_05240 [Myxococcales bacterium]|nr:hypothetical protein [Myxococcales bacterium]